MTIRTIEESYENVKQIEISADSSKIHIIFKSNIPTKTILWSEVIQILDE